MGLFKKRKKAKETFPIAYAPPELGLTKEQVEERIGEGLVNTPVEAPGKTTGQIIFSNIFTYFNAIFTLFAVCLIAVNASILNLSFMMIVIINTVIGIVQELKSKKVLDELSIVSATKAVCIRGGVELTKAPEELVRDDIVIFRAGEQIYADAELVSGECRVNEALVTGEADEIVKTVGDSLLSGSYLISGECRARLTAVGAEAFAAKLTMAAKKQKGDRRGEMMRSLTILVKILGVLLIPVAGLQLEKELVVLERPLTEAVTSVVGALVGMIPDGLYLLTSLALAAGLVRLAKKRTLCHEMESIETLSRVDVLCVDKTGTITENKMEVEDIVPLCPDSYPVEKLRLLMSDYVAALRDDNDTMAALRRYFTGDIRNTAAATLPFSSERKYGGVSFAEDETYLLGAPEFILGENYDKYKKQIEMYSSRGCRVLLLAWYLGKLEDEPLSDEREPLALLLLANKLRPEAPDTFAYFAEQDVAVKVISGDNAITVSEVAKRAGIPGAENYVDARTLDTPEKLRDAAVKCTVFGRVKPEQKRELVQALKKAGHTVAMTGDGVNDVLALKEADCSIAMASGSSAASQVAQIVLLDSDFSALPSVVSEGRRVVNNIQRSASLYLLKNIFSLIMAVITVVFIIPYPLVPARLGLVNYATIGLPSFIIAMEPNESRVKGRFLPNVIRAALPAALTDVILSIGVMLFYIAFDLADDTMGTIITGVLGVVGLLQVHRLCRPYTTIRKIMMPLLVALFFGSYFLLQPIFNLTTLDMGGILILTVFSFMSWTVLNLTEKYFVDPICQGIAKLCHLIKNEIQGVTAK